MRILSLNIDGYKMFTPSPKIKLGKDIQVFVGVNGSGKSSVLEAIAIIFSQVKKYCTDGKIRERRFNFSIEYSFLRRTVVEETSTTQNVIANLHHVILTSSREAGLDYTMAVDEEYVTTWQEMYQYLPDNLIFYYAGFDDTLEKIVEVNEQETAESLYNVRRQEDVANIFNEFSKSFVYIRKHHFPLLFILNYIDNKMALPLTGKEFMIYNISLQLQKPPSFGNEEYATFYNIQGYLKSFLENLLQHSQQLEEVKEGKKHLGAILTVEYHRGILEAVEDLPNIPANNRFDDTRYLAFHLINLLFQIGILQSIDVSIRDAEGKIYSIADFSEGEQQLVSVEAINKILCKDNTVLFFDEPDAFLHPQRQREILPHLIRQFSSRSSEEYTQLIVTTHSPFVAQSVNLDNILLFNKSGSISHPHEEMLSYVSISEDLFGIKSEFKKEIENDLRNFQKKVKEILIDKREVDATFRRLRDKLIAYGESVQVIVNFEIRKLIKEGKYHEENA